MGTGLKSSDSTRGERSGRSPSSESGRAPSPCPELWSHGKASLSAVQGRAIGWRARKKRTSSPSSRRASHRPAKGNQVNIPGPGQGDRIWPRGGGGGGREWADEEEDE